MSEYLWNRDGAPDEVEAFLEQYGAELGYDAQLATRTAGFAEAPRWRWWFTPLLAAAITAALGLGWRVLMRPSPTPQTVEAMPALPPAPEKKPMPRVQQTVLACTLTGGCTPPLAPVVVEEGSATKHPRAARKEKPKPDRRAVDSGLRARLFDRDLEACFDAAPGVSGQGIVAFVVGADGRVSEPKVDSARYSDEALGASVSRCVVRRVRSWKFPPPAEPPMRVRLPFVFK